MKIPSRWLPFVEVAAAQAPAGGQVRARAEKLLKEHGLSRTSRLSRSLARRKGEKAERAHETGATKAIREAVATRAGGRCEACGAEVNSRTGELDHFFGRARSENVETCWFLCGACHLQKTTSTPGRRFWLLRFERHCTTNGLGRAITMVRQLLALEQGRGATT